MNDLFSFRFFSPRVAEEGINSNAFATRGIEFTGINYRRSNHNREPMCMLYSGLNSKMNIKIFKLI